MPKPLGQQPDDKPVHEQVQELIRKAHTDRQAPVGIVFSPAGYTKAMGQSVPGMQAFTGKGGGIHIATHYLGLPFTVSHSLTTGDVLLDLVPGGSAEAKAFRDAKRSGASDVGAAQAAGYGRPQPFSLRVDGQDPHGTTMDIIVGALSKAQLCDLVQGWAEAHPNDDMSVALRDAVRNYGRFE